MPHIPLRHAPRLIWYGTRNYFTGRPLVVSFEVTLNCNANCRHCDLGGELPDERPLAPERYAEYVRRFRPVAVQLSGGEPLLRDDLPDIVRHIKLDRYTPYTILVSNGHLLTLERLRQLRGLGVNQFSISLDFPDARHDDFRCIDGLFDHLDRTIPTLAREAGGDVVLNTAITSANVRELPAIVETARRWGVCLSFSVYTPLRTQNPALVVADPADQAFVADLFEKCKRREGVFAQVVNSRANLDGVLRFIRQGTVPRCTAGRRFLVVRPDGLLNPCSLQRTQFETQADMVRDFSARNTCGGCYVSIRSYVEVPFFRLLWENLALRVFAPRGR